MRGILPESIRTRTWKSDFSAFVTQGVSDDAREILHTLDRNCLAVRFGFLDPERLAPELTRMAALLTAEDCSSSWDVADTYGLEIWLRVFLGGQVLNEEHA
jgi:hypothetical protein